MSGYIMRENILSAYFGGLKNLLLTILKNFKNVFLALFVQVTAIFLIMTPGSGKIGFFRNLTRENRNFLLLWILPHLLFITILYFPKNGYLLGVITGMVILVMSCYGKEILRRRLKWLWAVNLMVFFIPLNIDYFQAKVRVSGENKSRREYFLSQAVRVFETTNSHLRSMKRVYERYFSDIRDIDQPGKELFILDNIVADYRVLPYYLPAFDFMIVQKEKTCFIVSFFRGENNQVKLVERRHGRFRLPGYDSVYLVTSTPSRYPVKKREIKQTIYKLFGDSITVNDLKILVGNND